MRDLVILRGGRGTHTSAPRSLSPFLVPWEALVATAGFASRSWSERAPGELRGGAAPVPPG
eukprot:5404983-Pyramimonas_sp.AAC.1